MWTRSDQTAGRNTHRIISILLFVAAALFLVRTAGSIGWDVLSDRILYASPALIALTVAVNLTRYALWGARWTLLLRPLTRIPWWAALRALMASLFVTTVVPVSRPFGGLVRAGRLGRALGCRTGPLYGATLLDQLGYGVVSLALGAVLVPAALWARRSGEDPGPAAWAGGAIALGLAFVLIWRRRADMIGRLRRRFPAAADTSEAALSAVRTLIALPSTWGVLALGGAVVWCMNVLTFRIAAAALGTDLLLVAAATAYAVGSLAGTASGTPGGAGTTELAALGPLLAFGIPAESAMAIVLLARGVHYASALLIGGAVIMADWLRDNRRSRQAPRR